MDDELKVGLLLGVIFFAVVGAGAWMFSAYQCGAKWERSGFRTDFGPIQGCLISRDGREWIPAENYRELP